MVEYGSGRWGPDQPTERAWKPSSRPQDTILVGLIRMMGSSNPSMMALPPIPSRAWKMTTAGRRKVWQGQRSHHGESVTTRGSAKPEGRDAASPLSPGARQARPLPRPAVGAKVSSHRPFVLESWRCPPPDHRSPRLPTRFTCASSAGCTPTRWRADLARARADWRPDARRPGRGDPARLRLRRPAPVVVLPQRQAVGRRD